MVRAIKVEYCHFHKGKAKVGKEDAAACNTGSVKGKHEKIDGAWSHHNSRQKLRFPADYEIFAFMILNKTG